ncbi:MAG: GNAT family N-acetyltransferase [Sphingobacteriia bacterium]|nr:GNAT family N-acetyltransferase [Sphingobacteriia bacterium]
MSFDFSHDYILQNECVLLRSLTENDCDNLLEFSLNEPDTWKYGLVSAAGKENLIQYIQQAMAGRIAEKMYPFIVWDKRTGEYAGSTRLYDINLPFKTLQLGYTWYGERFRGTGLNKHCKYLLLEFAFETMDMLRVEFRADNTNLRSIAAMKSIGCKVEGVLRQDVPKVTGGRRDSIVLSILKEEWLNEVKHNLKAQLK